MIERLADLPPYVVGLKAVGEVTQEDYDNVVLPAVNKVTKEYEGLSFLMVLETDIKNITFGAWMRDAWISLKEYAHWKRVAVVTDQKVAATLNNSLRYVFPGESKSFSFDELEQARTWVTEALIERKAAS